MFEIGTSLREARVRQGVDLLEAERATKIRSKYLRALEDERFELLPAQTYVKGFLRSYADYLGLDGQLYVDEYNSRYVGGEDEAPLRPRRTRQSQAHRRVESGVLLITLAGIAVVTALVIVAWRFSGGEATQPQANVPITQARETPDAPVEPVAKPWNRVEVRATRGNSRITVYRRDCGARGILLYDGTLERGRTKEWAGRRLCLHVTTPRNVDTLLNGRPARLPGDGTRPIVALATGAGIAAAPPPG
jgi:cytoskeleton protein RodZ